MCLSAMICFETPHVNVLTKCDLLQDKDISENILIIVLPLISNFFLIDQLITIFSGNGYGTTKQENKKSGSKKKFRPFYPITYKGVKTADRWIWRVINNSNFISLSVAPQKPHIGFISKCLFTYIVFNLYDRLFFLCRKAHPGNYCLYKFSFKIIRNTAD